METFVNAFLSLPILGQVGSIVATVLLIILTIKLYKDVRKPAEIIRAEPKKVERITDQVIEKANKKTKVNKSSVMTLVTTARTNLRMAQTDEDKEMYQADLDYALSLLD